MENEHQGYAFTKALLRARTKAALIDTAVGIAMIVIPALAGFWLAGFSGTIFGGIVGIALGVLSGYIPFGSQSKERL